jgi:phosphate transport system substrate-binding protein
MKIAALAFTSAIALAACSESSDAGAGGDQTAATIECATGTLSGEGSSFQKNAITEWIKLYQEQCTGATINYNATGSGAGIKQFLAGQVDFAGSDSALKEEEAAAALTRCANNPAWNLPMVTGAITMSYNIDGVEDLVLSPDVAAKIFLGQITTWDDPAIAGLNPDATLPSAPITVFFRSDESGTTDNFTKWLSAAAPQVWTAPPAKAWPTGATGEGKEKNSGLLEAVSATPNSISYIDYSDALAGGLTYAQVDLGSGPVELNAQTAGAAMELAEVVGEGNDLKLKLDYGTTEAGVYPVVAVAYEIVCSAGLPQTQADLLQSFLTFTASEAGQAELERIGYIPLPASVETKVAAAVEALA